MRETAAALQAWLDYAAMPPAERSLDALQRRYADVTDPPTRSFATLMHWSVDHGWQARLAERVAAERADAEAAIRAKRAEVFEQGLGLDFNRVTIWKGMAQKAATALNAADFGTHLEQARNGEQRIVPNTPPRYIEVQAHLLETALSQIREEQAGGVRDPNIVILMQTVYESAREYAMPVAEYIDLLPADLQAKLRPALMLEAPRGS